VGGATGIRASCGAAAAAESTCLARLFAALASAAPPATTTAALPDRRGDALLHQLRRVVHQQRVQVDAVRQDEVANVAAPNRERVERDRFLALERHLHLLEVSVHRNVDARDSAVDDGAILQLQ